MPPAAQHGRTLAAGAQGLDDAWQDCGKGVNHSFHNADGKPLIRPDRFPDMAAMNSYARSKGVGSGWYGNTCDCCEKGSLQPMWSAPGDAKAVKDLGFDGLKLGARRLPSCARHHPLAAVR